MLNLSLRAASETCIVVHQLHLDWTRGGEGSLLRKALASYVTAFHNVGLRPIFVWDGTFTPSKLETVKARLQSGVRNNIAFMRSGTSLRANRGFQVETLMLPVLATRACIAALQELHVEQHFPPGEADPVISELAIEKRAYIASLDSDFFVTSLGSKGYIPLDTLSFTCSPERGQAQPTETPDVEGEEDDWAPVKSRSSSRSHTPLGTSQRRVGRQGANGSPSALPATTLDDIAKASELHCQVYDPAVLAAYLGITTAWLPLLAILGGNDYYQPPIWRTAGSPSGSAQRRIEVLGAAMLKVGSKLNGKGGNTPKKGSANGSSLAAGKELTSLTLHGFLTRILDEVREFALTEGQVSDIASRCMTALSQYSTSALCALAPFLPPPPSTRPDGQLGADSPLGPLLSTPDDAQYLLKTRLLNAFEHGNLRNALLQVVSYGLYAPLALLEDPDLMSCHISCGRQIRLWVYAILHESVGIKQQQEEGAINEGGEDEKQDAPEEVALEPMDGEISRPASEAEKSEDGMECASSVTPAPIVTEYVRRSAALVSEEVPIRALVELVAEASATDPNSQIPRFPALATPALASSTAARFAIFLLATSCSTSPILAEPSGPHLAVLPVIATLRHLTATFQDSRTQCWTARERRAALAMAYLASHGLALAVSVEACAAPRYQRAAQVTSTLHAVSMLVEALLLTPLISPGELLFDGRLFHRFLEMSRTELDNLLAEHLADMLPEFEQLVQAMEEGLPRDAGEHVAPSKAQKKVRKKERQAQAQAQAQAHIQAVSDPSAIPPSRAGKAPPRNPFELLG